MPAFQRYGSPFVILPDRNQEIIRKICMTLKISPKQSVRAQKKTFIVFDISH